MATVASVSVTAVPVSCSSLSAKIDNRSDLFYRLASYLTMMTFCPVWSLLFLWVVLRLTPSYLLEGGFLSRVVVVEANLLGVRFS